MAKMAPRQARIRRHLRVRRKVTGVAERPRLAVFRSLNHIYAQVIDDQTGRALVSACSLEKELREGAGKKTEKAKEVGTLLAQRALASGINTVVFDRGGFIYHGRVKALAEAAREGGLQF